MGKNILLSTIGSRGDVQPLLALAVELRALGHEARLCLPPNFKEWIESFGFRFTPIGADVQKYMASSSKAKAGKPSFDQVRQMVRASVIDQFKVTMEAGRDCHLIVVANGVHHAGRSVAEALGIPFVFVTYCPATLNSPHHAPPNAGHILGWPGRIQTWPKFINRLLWKVSDHHWNKLHGDALNEQRALLGQSPVRNVPHFIQTDEPWIAADPTMAPAAPGLRIVQTGAWFLSDPRPLPASVEKFLNEGEPPIYFGFGSMRGNEDLNRTAIEATRSLGYRAIASKGWSGFQLPDDRSDCLAIDDVSFEALFPRVAAIVHHGGAGTTTAAARAGKPQVIAPHMYDQFYFAHRTEQLGIGASGGIASKCSLEKLTDALRRCLESGTQRTARSLAGRIERNGAAIAARRLS